MDIPSVSQRTRCLAFCLPDFVFLSPPPAGSRSPFAAAPSPLHPVQGQAVWHRHCQARGARVWPPGSPDPRVLAVDWGGPDTPAWPGRPRGPGHLVPAARGPARDASCLERGDGAWEKQAFASRGQRWERTHASSGWGGYLYTEIGGGCSPRRLPGAHPGAGGRRRRRLPLCGARSPAGRSEGF